jgi:hypothetical protein
LGTGLSGVGKVGKQVCLEENTDITKGRKIILTTQEEEKIICKVDFG